MFQELLWTGEITEYVPLKSNYATFKFKEKTMEAKHYTLFQVWRWQCDGQDFFTA